ncbi:hypothetical protein KI387_019224 [Taxus chinensis]|uniref:Uncharacterized protein n=1 Tax=Taxus chinensis TaxID=29808 RepID=A0AA38G9D2_TAXCH|nr:hypothetical protein KI387_019224 [Taxus chinensis]
MGASFPASILSINQPPWGSHIWNFILSYHSMFLQSTSWLIGNGELANFWDDSWNGYPTLGERPKFQELKRILIPLRGEKVKNYGKDLTLSSPTMAWNDLDNIPISEASKALFIKEMDSREVIPSPQDDQIIWPAAKSEREMVFYFGFTWKQLYLIFHIQSLRALEVMEIILGAKYMNLEGRPWVKAEVVATFVDHLLIIKSDKELAIVIGHIMVRPKHWVGLEDAVERVQLISWPFLSEAQVVQVGLIVRVMYLEMVKRYDILLDFAEQVIKFRKEKDSTVLRIPCLDIEAFRAPLKIGASMVGGAALYGQGICEMPRFQCFGRLYKQRE